MNNHSVKSVINTLWEQSKRRESSQRVAAIWLVLLVLIILCLLVGQDTYAEKFAIYLYYVLVISVVLGLSVEVRQRLWNKISIRRKAWTQKAHGSLHDVKNSPYTQQWLWKFHEVIQLIRTNWFIRWEELLLYMKQKPDFPAIQSNIRRLYDQYVASYVVKYASFLERIYWRSTETTDKNNILYILCLFFVMVIAFLSSNVFHIQLMQYIMPDVWANAFASMPSGTHRLFGISLISCIVVIFILCMPEDYSSDQK